MSREPMPESMRFTKTEQKKLHETCVKLNKKLMGMDKMPIRESELAHLLIDECIERAEVNKSGEITFTS